MPGDRHVGTQGVSWFRVLAVCDVHSSWIPKTTVRPNGETQNDTNSITSSRSDANPDVKEQYCQKWPE